MGATRFVASSIKWATRDTGNSLEMQVPRPCPDPQSLAPARLSACHEASGAEGRPPEPML